MSQEARGTELWLSRASPGEETVIEKVRYEKGACWKKGVQGGNIGSDQCDTGEQWQQGGGNLSFTKGFNSTKGGSARTCM